MPVGGRCLASSSERLEDLGGGGGGGQLASLSPSSRAAHAPASCGLWQKEITLLPPSSPHLRFAGTVRSIFHVGRATRFRFGILT